MTTKSRSHRLVPEAAALVKIDHASWVECPNCRALNMADDAECFICHRAL